MRVAIHQPAYMPWLGYFDKIAMVDKFIILDTVQFEKNSFDNRNKIRTDTGWIWLTVPVFTKGRFRSNDWQKLEINNFFKWGNKHLRSLRQNYCKSSFWPEIAPFFEDLFSQRHDSLLELNMSLLKFFMDQLGISTPIVKASVLKPRGEKQDLVLDLLYKTEAKEYLSGALGRAYLDPTKFAQSGIELKFQEYRHPVYEQVFTGFERGMSIIDLLANHGPESLSILCSN